MSRNFAFLPFALALAAGPALAQPLPPGASPGLPGPQSVNPAPGARGPYLGHPNTFYDPMDRLHDLDSRLETLPPRQARRVRAELHRVNAFAEMQRSRHGGKLRDWDRERMMRMMNDLVRRYPDLKS